MGSRGVTWGHVAHRVDKLVEVVAAVVGRDDDEGVNVREGVGEGEVDQRVLVEEATAGQQQQRRGQREEAQREVRPHHAADVVAEAEA
eukprot:664478-Prymnesium_polylepis.1